MLLKTSLLKNVSQNRFLSNQNRYVTANEKNRLINRWLVQRIRNYAANYAQILEDAPSKSNFKMKKDNVFVVCFRFSKFFHLTKLFKLLEFFRFNCFNLRKGNTNVHVHDYKFLKKNLATLSYLHFDEADMLFSKIINFQTLTLCSNLEIRQTNYSH